MQATAITPNVILAGDYNADGSYFDEDTLWPTLFDEAVGTGTLGDAFVQIVDNSIDTTVASGSNTYDRIIISVSLQSDSIAAGGGAGIAFNYDQYLDWTVQLQHLRKRLRQHC